MKKRKFTSISFTPKRQEIVEVDEAPWMTGIGFYMQSSPIAMYAMADRKLHIRKV